MGNEPSTGSSPESQRSTRLASSAHGNLTSDAIAFLGRSANPTESLSSSPREIRRQADELVDWATEKGLVLSDNHFVGLQKQELPTTEHEVFYRAADHRAVKRTYPGAYGFAHGPKGKRRRATPLYYLERLELMNRVFGSDFRVEGIGLGKPQSSTDEEKRPYIVI